MITRHSSINVEKHHKFTKGYIIKPFCDHPQANEDNIDLTLGCTLENEWSHDEADEDMVDLVWVVKLRLPSVKNLPRRHNEDTRMWIRISQIYGLVQEWCNSSALAMELRLSCTNPSKCIKGYMIKPFCDHPQANQDNIVSKTWLEGCTLENEWGH